MLRNVCLYGEMGETFGKSFRLDVVSLADAACALGCQLQGFKKYLIEHDYNVFCGKATGEGLELCDTQIDMNLPEGDIHIVPVLAASKSAGSSATAKIIAGVLIAAVAWWAAPIAVGLSGTIVAGLTYGNVVMLGLGLAVTGISQLMSKNKKPEPQKAENSFMLSGAINVTEQGGPVPLVYGSPFVGSVVISAGVTTADTPITYVPPLGP